VAVSAHGNMPGQFKIRTPLPVDVNGHEMRCCRMDGIGTIGPLLRSLIVTVFDGLVFGLLVLPGFVVLYVAGTVCLGLAGRLLRRRGRLPGASALAGVMGVVFFVLFTTIVIGWSNHLNRLPTVLFGIACIGGSAVLTGVSVVAVAAALPRRRRTGPRQRLNRLASRGVEGLGCLIALTGPPTVFVLVLLSSSGLIDRLQGVVVAILGAIALVAVGGLVFVGAERLRPPDIGKRPSLKPPPAGTFRPSVR
jgi:hypothetical protein